MERESKHFTEKKNNKIKFQKCVQAFFNFFLLHIHDPLIAFGSLSNLIGEKKKKKYSQIFNYLNYFFKNCS